MDRYSQQGAGRFASYFSAATADPDIRLNDSFHEPREKFKGTATQANCSYK